jgi:hypothetical protein
MLRHSNLLFSRVLGALLALPLASFAAEPADSPSAKAEFVFNFMRFTVWPDEVWNSSERVQLCVGGEHGELSQALTAFDRRALRGHELRIRLLGQNEKVDGCHALVVTDQRRGRAEWLARARGKPVLTVGEAAGFAESGGMIGLYTDDSALRFEINPDAVRRGGLRVSIQLFRLARIVKDRPPAQ